MKLFVMLSRVPWPLEKGDKLRAYHQVSELSKKHEVTLCCLSDSPVHPDAMNELTAIAHRVEIFQLSKPGIWFNLLMGLFSNKPYQVKYFYQNRVKKKVDALIDEVKPDHIYCQLVRASEYVKEQHNIPKTIDYMDTFSKGMERRIASSSFLKKPFVRSEHKRLLAYENLVFEYFKHKTIISEQDRNLIYHPDRDQIKVVPNGVDTTFFSPMPMEKDYDVVFIGNMNYVPNITAAVFLAREIVPLLKSKMGGIKVLISGATPAPAVTALASDHITISGWVEDIRESYARSRVFIAPMHIGTGLQNKLLEAMAMEIPSVTSPLANNALGGEDGTHLLLANTPEAYAEHILQLLEQPEKAAVLAKKGREFVDSRFDWAGTTQLLNELMFPGE